MEVWSAGIAHKVPCGKAGRKLSVMHVASCLRDHVLNMFVSVAHGHLYSEDSEQSYIRLDYSITSRRTSFPKRNASGGAFSGLNSQVSRWPVFLLCTLI